MFQRENLSPEDIQALKYYWPYWARAKQLVPTDGDWQYWFLCTGRRFGKTRCAAEQIRALAESGRARYMALVGPTFNDVINVMLAGESGLLNISPPWFKPEFSPTYNMVTWPNGVTAEVLSAEKPDKPRGRGFSWAWCDEVAMWENLEFTWKNLQMAMSSGEGRVVVTTTPRPSSFIRKLAKDPRTFLVEGETRENDALSARYLTGIYAEHEGTRWGDQELRGSILDEFTGALWSPDNIRYAGSLPSSFSAVVVAVDPAMTSHRESDETGIIIAGISGNVCFILEDCSGRMSPDQWGQLVADKCVQYDTKRVVCEVNQGGDLALNVIRTKDASLRVAPVRATKGKMLRAEPVAGLYQQRRVFHAKPFEKLETQMTEWTSDVRKGGDVKKMRASPDRLDALVYAVTDLMFTPRLPRLYCPSSIRV